MNKKVIIAIVVGLSLLLIIVLSYFITSSMQKDNNEVKNEEANTKVENTEKSEDKKVIVKKEYTDININSALATELFNFVPKYLQSITDKLNNEYIVYASISSLEEQNKSVNEYEIGDGQFPGYKSTLVEENAKKMFGESTTIVKKETYNLPIGYSKKEDVFCKFPVGFGSQEEFQTIKSLKENDKNFILELYALNLEYDIEDLKHVYISTKDTFKLYKNSESDDTKIKNSMKKYNAQGIQVEPVSIINTYKNDLPIIEYTIEKLDERGTKYFVKNIRYILD